MIEVGSRKKNAIQIGRQKLLLQKNDRSMKILQGREIKYLDGHWPTTFQESWGVVWVFQGHKGVPTVTFFSILKR